MKTNDFDYELPKELIAQSPLLDRSSSRLLVLDKRSGEIRHDIFKNIFSFLKRDDVLVLNDTKVLPARLFGIKTSTSAKIEILLLQDFGDYYEVLVKPAKRIHMGECVNFGDGLLIAHCVKCLAEGICHFRFEYEGQFLEILEKLGSMPLPPYITEKLTDKERYQTVYAKNPGSSAAPTAGLHFTNDLILELKEKGIKICYITLHVGLGTFRPVNVDDIKDHKMHFELYEITKESADILNMAKANGKRIIAIGTTSARTLESAYQNEFIETKAKTDIFIYPGYKFKAIDGLITNFHLPKSTLLMLVSALASKEYIFGAYHEAIKEKYRFFSFGDAMLII